MTSLFFLFGFFASMEYANTDKKGSPLKKSSMRTVNTDPPFIEDVLESYSVITDLTKLALGSSHWHPPCDELSRLLIEENQADIHRYGSIMGMTDLRNKIIEKHQLSGPDMSTMEVMVTAGANQAFVNAALTICDDGDNAIILSPFYFSHKSTLQLAGVNIHTNEFNATTLKPNWDSLRSQIIELKPSIMVLTNPNNPSGMIYSENDIENIIDICKLTNTWLVVDQTYYEFYYNNNIHIFPCGTKYNYDRIIHLFSFSKSFGMPGWRVGYLLYPLHLSPQIRKIQDAFPTHCSMIGQALALRMMKYDEEHQEQYGQSWVASRVSSLNEVRAAVWDAVSQTGPVHSEGAFYFLIPVPSLVSEEEAVDILATKYGVLLMHGGPFGAKQHLRLSYGSLPPEDVIAAADRLKNGLAFLLRLSQERSIEQEDRERSFS
mmetsp:Transcript_11541/g.11556  ORF Transcript_11541/g.11556 Transcript_11541/m.11556 type:complete len:433 (+) Transcript_11541:41-1339(+)